MKHRKYRLQWKKFVGRLLCWILGIPINVIPIVFSHITGNTQDILSNIGDFLLLIISDLNFSFISVSVVFVLLLEGFFADEDTPPIYRQVQMVSAICFVGALVVYCVFALVPGFYSSIDLHTRKKFNLWLVALTLVLGIISNYLYSCEKVRQDT